MRPVFHLFTYGTLMPGRGPAAELLAACERVGEGHVRGTLYDMGDYPALLLGGDDRVKGVIWRCPAGLLPELDAYEGVADGLFRRIGTRVDGVACWIYVAGPRLGPRMTSDTLIPPEKESTQ